MYALKNKHNHPIALGTTSHFVPFDDVNHGGGGGGGRTGRMGALTQGAATPSGGLLGPDMLSVSL